MATNLLDTLIDKQDTFEIVRDKISEILFNEVANQMALATAASKNPELWNLQIFTERSNIWEQFLNQDTVKTPIVNIWYDNGNFPKNRGDVVERQTHEGVFNIDIYGFEISSSDGTGHKAGDKEAALKVQKAIRLVRNILMSDLNVYLQLPGIVGFKWPQSITVFQPRIDKKTVQQVVGARIALEAHFNEFSPQQTPETLELVSVDVKRTEDGEIVLKTDYSYPL